MAYRSLHRLWIFVLLVAVSAAYAPAAEEDKSQSKPVDYESLKVLIDTLDQIERNYVKDVNRRELVEAAIKGMLDKLDPYSNYISPKDLSRFETVVESKFGGIGIQIATQNGQLTVTSPLVGSPAYRAGVQAGDRIVKIEGESTRGISLNEAVSRLKGEAETSVTVTIIHVGENTEHTVTIKREVIEVETVMGDTRNDDDSWDFLIDHEKRIGYVRLTSFSRKTARDLRRALEELKKADMQGLVIDLRFNPGGLLSSAIEISDLFITEGKIVSTEGRNSKPRAWEAHAEGTYAGFPMAILVNRYSASASEIFSACMQDHKRATIIGERSFGKGSVQNVVRLEGGKSALKLTTAGYQRPSGKNIHKFPGAKDSDDWGVHPNEGFAMRLSDGDMTQLIRYRRDRDIVQPHKQPQPEPTEKKKPEDVKKPDDKKPDDKKPDDKKPDDKKPDDKKPDEVKPDEVKPEVKKPEKKDQAKPADDKKDDAPKQDPPPNKAPKPDQEDKKDDGKTSKDDPKKKTKDQSKDAEKNDPQEDKPDEPKKDVKKDSPQEDKPDEPKQPEFVDLQLQKALEFLTAELARAK